MRRLIIFGLLIMMWGCSSQKDVVSEEVVVVPDWVNTKPLNSSYYIGIGSTKKNSGTQYLRTAKENALSDLASEIKVNVSSNSLLHTLEQNDRFEQEYLETIRTKSDIDLEDFELVDSWESPTEYYTYYRLSKASYASRLWIKKQAAQSQGLSFYENAIEAKTSGQYGNAVQYCLQGLQSIEAFWNEDNTVTRGAESIKLDNVLYTQLIELVQSAQIEAISPLVSAYDNSFTPIATVLVSDGKQKYSQVPLKYQYKIIDGKYNGKVITNPNGQCEITIDDTPSNEVNTLAAWIDSETIFAPFYSDPFMRNLLNQVVPARAEWTIKYQPAFAYISSVEKNLGQKISPAILKATLQSELAQKGVKFVDNKSSADVNITVSSNTKEGGSSQGFASTFLNYNIEIRDRRTGESKFILSESNVKGVDTNFEKAGLKAYSNLVKNVEHEIISKLKNQVY